MTSPKDDDRFLSIEPDPSMVRKTRYVNLSIAEALGELIANSFDERMSPDQKMTIEVDLPEKGKGGVVRVADNGKGMDRNALQNALRLGKSDKKKGQKGMFGIGLKTASAVIGSKLTIETALSDTSRILRAELDIEELQEWKVPYQKMAREESVYFGSREGSGTVVEVSGLRKSSFHIPPVKSYLSLAFKHHLAEGDRIIIDGETLHHRREDLIHGTREEIEIPIGGNVVRGWAGLLIKGNVKSDFQPGSAYGINIYRNKQLVAAYFKGFLPGQHGDFGRVIGELHIDFVDVNYTKKGINFGNPDWPDVEKKVRSHVKKFAAASRACHTATKSWKRKRKGKLGKSDWQKLDPDLLSGSRDPDERETEVLARSRKMFKALGMDVGDGAGAGEGPDEEPEEGEDTIDTDEQVVIELVGENEIRLAGRNIRFGFVYLSDEESPWQWHQRSVTEDRLSVFLNRSFGPYCNAEQSESRRIMCILALAEELKEYLIGLGFDAVQSQKDAFDWINQNYDQIRVPDSEK